MDAVALESYTLHSDAPPDEGDKALLVRFHLKPRQDPQATKDAGRPIYKDVEYVSIRSGGDKFNEIDRPARQSDRRRFRHQYQAFKDGNAEILEGTPLSQWPLISASQVEELKFFHVRTVEQLATMPDGNISNVGNISHLKKQAADYIAVAKGQAPMVALRAELETEKAKARAEVEQLRQQLQEQSQLMARLMAKSDDEAPVAPRKRIPQSG